MLLVRAVFLGSACQINKKLAILTIHISQICLHGHFGFIQVSLGGLRQNELHGARAIRIF